MFTFLNILLISGQDSSSSRHPIRGNISYKMGSFPSPTSSPVYLFTWDQHYSPFISQIFIVTQKHHAKGLGYKNKIWFRFSLCLDTVGKTNRRIKHYNPTGRVLERRAKMTECLGEGKGSPMMYELKSVWRHEQKLSGRKQGTMFCVEETGNFSTDLKKVFGVYEDFCTAPALFEKMIEDEAKR